MTTLSKDEKHAKQMGIECVKKGFRLYKKETWERIKYLPEDAKPENDPWLA